MILSFDSTELFNEFDNCDCMSTDELVSDFQELLSLGQDCMELVEGLTEHGLAVAVLLALRSVPGGRIPET